MKDIAGIILVCLVLTSCSLPDSSENFVRVRNGRPSVCNFELDMSDTLARYDISIYTRRDVSAFKGADGTQLPLKITWTSPSYDQYREVVYIGAGDSDGDLHPYRTGVVPVEAGKWTLSVEPLEKLRGFRGIGIVLKRNGWDTEN